MSNGMFVVVGDMIGEVIDEFARGVSCDHLSVNFVVLGAEADLIWAVLRMRYCAKGGLRIYLPAYRRKCSWRRIGARQRSTSVHIAP
jgi:hypothetical protein